MEKNRSVESSSLLTRLKTNKTAQILLFLGAGFGINMLQSCGLLNENVANEKPEFQKTEKTSAMKNTKEQKDTKKLSSDSDWYSNDNSDSIEQEDLKIPSRLSLLVFQQSMHGFNCSLDKDVQYLEKFQQIMEKLDNGKIEPEKAKQYIEELQKETKQQDEKDSANEELLNKLASVDGKIEDIYRNVSITEKQKDELEFIREILIRSSEILFSNLSDTTYLTINNDERINIISTLLKAVLEELDKELKRINNLDLDKILTSDEFIKLVKEIE